MKTLKLSLAAVLCLVNLAQAADRDKTTPEIVNEAKATNKGPRVRVEAINKLAEITDTAQIRDYRVVEELVTLESDVNIDMFVRIAAIGALARIQVNAPTSKDKFLPSFITAIKDIKQHNMIRKSAADAFRDVLSKGLTDKDAYKACVDIAKNKSETPGLRASCVDVIGIYPADDSLENLVPMLSDTESFVVEHSAAALYNSLSRMGDKEIPLPAINKLVEMLDSKTVGPDLKVNVMKVVAAIIREHKTTAADAGFPKIVDFVKNAQEDKLVKGGIEALGIIASAAAVEPLKQAYLDYKPAVGAAKPAAADAKDKGEEADKKKENAKDTEIRQLIMDALGQVLITQGEKKIGGEPKAVHESAVLLVKAAEDDPSSNVQKAAIFSLRYLYYLKFKVEHKDAVDMLTFKMRGANTSDEFKLDISKTLQAITGQDFGLDAARWDKWFTDNGGGGKKK